MSKELVRLRELAKGAKPYCPAGKWYYGSGDRSRPDEMLRDISSDDDREFAIIYTRVEMPALAEYLAALDPTTILTLLDRIEALQRLCGRAAQVIETSDATSQHGPDPDASCEWCVLLAELREAAGNNKENP